ncbi:MAG: MerR family transcriptional regulator [Ilumatobacteraceae bacterium]
MTVVVTDVADNAKSDSNSDQAADGFSLAELATQSGVSVRTIRFYQAEHLLPRPAKRGRDAVYGATHVERLAVVADLRDRGLSLQTIKALVAEENPTRTISEWLGVDATLSAPWSDDRPRTVSHDELVATINRITDSRPGLIGELQDRGYLQPERNGNWTVPSPALLDHALQLRRAGIDIDISGKIRDLLRRRLAKAVDDTVALILDRSGAGFAGDATPDEVATAVGALRPIARDMSSVILAQEVERALAALVRSGPKSVRKRSGSSGGRSSRSTTA